MIHVIHVPLIDFYLSVSVPDKRRVSGQKPDSNCYLTRHWQKETSAEVFLQIIKVLLWKKTKVINRVKFLMKNNWKKLL